jgi:hypothetical protein
MPQLESLASRALSLGDLTGIIQASIGPVVLISGVGLLLLTMTNRLGRIVDRSRSLVREMDEMTGPDRARIIQQLRLLQRRAHLVRASVMMASACVLLAAILIGVLYLSSLFGVSVVHSAALLFFLCMAFLIGAMISFMREVQVSLRALELELRTR